MASGVRWRSRLHAVFERLQTNENESNGWKNIVQVKDGVLYVWYDVDRTVIAVDLADLQQSKSDDDVKFQSLVPSTPPVYDIDALAVDVSGQRIALVGRRGLGVLNLPPRRPADARRSLCSSTEVAERFFLCNPGCRLLQVKWHPGSDTSTHLVMLFSNNYLRVFDCRMPTTPVQVHQLGQVPVFRLSPSAASSFGAALGETAIDFDFGGAVRARDVDDNSVCWPLFVLWGNGDVYTMLMTNPNHCERKSEVRGPLTMHPPAEDNYGVDACSIVCLPGTVPVLAIATCSGMLYHCVVVDGGDDEEEERMAAAARPLVAPDVSLYVYESIELDLVLTTDVLAEDATYPIRLHRDPTTALRYHCSHAAGIHTVALPLVPQLQRLSAGGDVTDALSALDDQNCVIEHVMCTRPVASSPSAPVLGLAVAHGHALGGAALVCLTSPFDLVTVPLVPTYLDVLPRLLVDDDGNSPSPSGRASSKEPFDQHVRRILLRHTTHPLLKSHASADLTPQECAQVLSRATRVLREEYIEKLDLAKNEVQRRAKILEELRAQQTVELAALEKDKTALSERAGALAAKYERLRAEQAQLTQRAERVVRALLRRSPLVSDAEQSMRRELDAIHERLRHLRDSIDQVRAKRSYQAAIVERQRANEERRCGHAPENQLRQLRELLSRQSHQLNTLSDKMAALQLGLGV